jgi:WD40 repeat protein
MPDGVKKFGPEIWDLASAKRLVETEPLAPHVNALAWSPDGTMLAAGADYGDSAIYDAATGNRLWELPGKARIRSLAFSPDGNTLAVGYGGNGNGFVRLYDAGSLVASVANAPHAVRRAEDGPPGPSSNERDGLRRPSSDNAVGGATGVVDGTSSTDTTRNTTESDATRPHPSPLPEGEGADESNPKSKIENPKSSAPTTLTLLRELPCNSGPQDPEIAALRWSADGRTLQVLDRAAVYVFDATTGELLAQAPRLDRTPHDARPANFSPDGRFLAVATTCTRVWDLAEVNAAAERSRKSKVESQKSKEGTGNRAQGTENPKSKIQNPKLHLVASVVPLGHGQAVVVSADGHWLGTRGAEKEIVYVIQTAAGQETLTPREFYKRFGWKNDPSKVVLPE